MRAITRLCCVALVLSFSAASVRADEPDEWKGVQVLYKRNDLKLRTEPDESKASGQVRNSMGTVQFSRGEWLRLWGTDVGYVRKSEVVTLADAVEYFTDQVRADPKNAFFFSQRGVALNEKGEHDLAIRDFTEAIGIDGKASWYFNRGKSWDDKGESDKAIADFSEAIRRDPKFAPAYRIRAFVWLRKRDLDKAITDYDSAIALEPKNPLGFVSRGRAWIEKGDYEKAIADLDKGLQLSPRDSYGYYARGLAWFMRKEYEKAIDDFDKHIQLNPKDKKAYLNRGVAWARRQDHDKAIADFTEAIRLNPKDAYVYQGRGDIRAQKREYDKAIADYNEAIAINPNQADSFISRGLAYKKMQQYDKAIADYTEAVRLDPKEATAYGNHAWLLATCSDEKFRNGRQAVALAKQACELSERKNAYHLSSLAAAHAEAGEFEDAVTWQKKAVDLVVESDKAKFRSRLELYQQRKPYRDEPKP